MADRTLSDARIIVTGATGGFGSRLTRRLIDEGAQVVATARDADALAELGAAETVAVDLTAPEAMDQILDAAGDRIDGLVNAAGVVAFGPLADTDVEVVDTLFAVNAIAPLRLIHAVLPRLVDGGFIANISGIVAEQPTAGLTSYSASKAAIGAATTALRRELRKQRIDVVDLRPPHTDTGLATRPIAGEAPPLPDGADPDVVADIMLEAIRTGARVVGPDDFQKSSS